MWPQLLRMTEEHSLDSLWYKSTAILSVFQCFTLWLLYVDLVRVSFWLTYYGVLLCVQVWIGLPNYALNYIGFPWLSHLFYCSWYLLLHCLLIQANCILDSMRLNYSLTSSLLKGPFPNILEPLDDGCLAAGNWRSPEGCVLKLGTA